MCGSSSGPAAPTRGTSLKLPLLALVFLFAGFTALCVGLLRVFTRRGLRDAGHRSGGRWRCRFWPSPR